MTGSRRKLIAVDFDGVLHSYTTPWSDAATISDGPVPGAMQFLRALVDDDRFEVAIVSSRLTQEGGLEAVESWLRYNLKVALGWGAGDRVIGEIGFYKIRPPAFITIDDRGLTFTGEWPDLDTMAAFKPWNKRPVTNDTVELIVADLLPDDDDDDEEPGAMYRRALARAEASVDRRRQITEWALKDVVGGVRGFGVERGANGLWHVLMQDGSKAFSILEGDLPDQHGAARKVVGALYSAWLDGVRGERARAAAKGAAS